MVTEAVPVPGYRCSLVFLERVIAKLQGQCNTMGKSPNVFGPFGFGLLGFWNEVFSRILSIKYRRCNNGITKYLLIVVV